MNKTFPVLATLGVAALSAQAQVLLNEPFSYSDGAIHTVSSGAWAIHSPATPTTPLLISNGRAFIDQNDTTGNRDDANRALSQTFNVLTDNTTKLYASFTAQFTALPFNAGTATAGSYFAHFKSSAANEFYARIGANAEGAAAGKFRMAIANEGWANGATTTEFPSDLSLNVTYRVVVRLDLAADQSTLWIDPTSESSSSVTATDGFTFVAGSVSAFALRQGTSGTSPNTGGPGDLYVDNLLVGLSFADVTPVPEPGAYALMAGLGLFGFAMWRRRAPAAA